MGKSEQPKVRHRMGRPCAVFRELQVVKALGIYCWGVQGARGQVGVRRGKGGWDMYPKKRVVATTFLQVADQSYVSDICPWKLCGDEPTHWSSSPEGQFGLARSRNR